MSLLCVPCSVILMLWAQDPAILGFLLTNLDSTPDGVRFRLPLDILLQHIAEIGEFPYAPGERTWDGPALFIKGKKSPYVTPSSSSM
jgi:hypothetical protein